MSQSLLNGTWWGRASSHGECFNAWDLPSLRQGGRAEDQGEMSPHYLGEHGPSWGWLGLKRKQESVLSLRFIFPKGATQIGSRGSGDPRKVRSQLCICMWAFFFLERRARVFIKFFKVSVTPPQLKAARIVVPERMAPPHPPQCIPAA